MTEGFGDPDYRRPTSVRREVEPAGFELVERFGGLPGLHVELPETGVLVDVTAFGKS